MNQFETGGFMKKSVQIQSVVLYGVFICYILFLIKLLLLSRVSLQELFNNQSGLSRSINLIPFRNIMEYIFGHSIEARRFAFSNVVGNIAIFIPLGIYLTLLKKDKRVTSTLLVIFLVSLFVEVIQGFLGLGTADIDDIILNCLGGLIGIFGYKFLLILFRDSKRVHVAITILSVFGLPVILYLLFMIKLSL